MEPQTYRVKLSDGREFDVTADGGPPSEEEIYAQLGKQPGPQGSAISRFASNAWDVLNPVGMVKGVYDAVTSPVETGKAIYGAQMNQLQKARQAFGEGRYSEALGHTAATALPLVGPIAADAGEQIGSGDIAGGLGKTTGILLPFGMASSAKRFGLRVAPNRAADALEAGASARVVDVMSPKASTQVSRRLGEKAKKIAPEILKENRGGWSRAALQEQILGKLRAAEDALDDATDARLEARAIETEPVLDALRDARRTQTIEATDASLPAREVTTRPSAILDASGQPMEVTTARELPYGRDVVPGPNQPRVSMIDQAIGELEQLGPTSTYEPLRKMRQSYDGPAKTVYNPSLVDDFLKKSGEAKGAADVTAAIRETLAKVDPATAQANGRYALYKGATDIIEAAEQVEKARPKVGRKIMARLTGTIFGAQAGGPAGALAGLTLGPAVEGLLNAGFTTQLQTARIMADIADAIRGSNQVKLFQLEFKLRDLAKQATKAEAIRGSATQAAQPQAP